MKDVGYINIWIEQEHDSYWENIKIIKEDLKDEYAFFRNTFDDSLNSYSFFLFSKEDAVAKIKYFLGNVLLKIKEYSECVNTKIPFEKFSGFHIGLDNDDDYFESEDMKLRFSIESGIYDDVFKESLLDKWIDLVNDKFNPKKKYKATVQRTVVIEASSKAEALNLLEKSINNSENAIYSCSEIEEIS
jgi:hypothetical protein